MYAYASACIGRIAVYIGEFTPRTYKKVQEWGSVFAKLEWSSQLNPHTAKPPPEK